MSDVISTAVAALAKKLPDGFDGVAKFVMQGEGSIMVDPNGVRAGDDDCGCDADRANPRCSRRCWRAR